MITAKSIRSLKVGPADYTTQTAQNPTLVNTGSTGTATHYLVNPVPRSPTPPSPPRVPSASVSVTGDQLNSEIKTGFDYQSYLAGLEGTREASRIARLKLRGDLVSSVDSATFSPAKDAATDKYVYSHDHRKGGCGFDHRHQRSRCGTWHSTRPPIPRSTLAGSAYNTGGRTALGNYGAGVFAEQIQGNLPKSNCQ